jgi:hypothetical protein
MPLQLLSLVLVRACLLLLLALLLVTLLALPLLLVLMLALLPSNGDGVSAASTDLLPL